MSRSAPQILHEIDYWQLLLKDLLALNDEIGEAAGALMEANVHLIYPAIVHAEMQGGAQDVDRALGSVKQGMSALGRMQDHLERILDLANGRAEALHAEIDSGISESSD